MKIGFIDDAKAKPILMYKQVLCLICVNISLTVTWRKRIRYSVSTCFKWNQQLFVKSIFLSSVCREETWMWRNWNRKIIFFSYKSKAFIVLVGMGIKHINELIDAMWIVDMFTFAVQFFWIESKPLAIIKFSVSTNQVHKQTNTYINFNFIQTFVRYF